MIERGPMITQILRGVAELPDRTSPEDQPEMMLVSFDEMEGILEAIIPAEQEQEWQPIETAPKDKTIIITGRYANGRAYVEEGYWHPHGHFNARKFDPPTHWMPMPEPYGGWDAEPAPTAAEGQK